MLCASMCRMSYKIGSEKQPIVPDPNRTVEQVSRLPRKAREWMRSRWEDLKDQRGSISNKLAATALAVTLFAGGALAAEKGVFEKSSIYDNREQIEYTIQPNDTLQGIAENHMESIGLNPEEEDWRPVASAIRTENGIGSEIFASQVILMPGELNETDN